MNLQYDEELVRLFVRKDRQARYLNKLNHPKQRDQILGLLWVGESDFDARYLVELDKKLTTEQITSLLRDKGAGKQAYLFNINPDLENQVLPVADAVALGMAERVTFVVYCLDARVAFYQSEHGDYYLLARP